MKTPLLFLATATLALAAEPPEPRFTAVTLDAKIQIGYGLAIADVDGDKAPDVLVADKRQIVWYRNPGPAKARDAAAWTKHLIAENLTQKDNVCLAAQDLDGDGKCELAVGAEWNPGDTEQSGAVFYLIPPADRTQRWEPVKFPSVEPTTHRMRFMKLADESWGLVVLPLHGRGNKNGEGERVRMLLYENLRNGTWTRNTVISDAMHITHNFDVVRSPTGADELVVAGQEGVTRVGQDYERNRAIIVGGLTSTKPIIRPNPGPVWAEPEFSGAGEVRVGNLPEQSARFIATVEPMHGDKLVIYPGLVRPFSGPRRILTDKLTEGHALACGDLLGVKSDQIVVGWRGNPAKADSTCGIHLWTPLDATGEKWRDSAVDDGGMACEDLQLADLDGDGRLDIAASGRATKNVKLYFNDTPHPEGRAPARP